MSGARLRMLDRAEKELLKLPRSVKGAIYDFQHKFRTDPENKGLRFKQLKGDSQLYSARVNDDYRALLLHAGGDEYILVAVRPRAEAYDNLDRFRHQINPVTGGIEFVDLVVTEEAVSGPGTAGSPYKVGKDPSAPAADTPLFAAYSPGKLLELGVAEPLLSLIGKITTEDELLALVSYAPQLTGEVLLALYDGRTPDEVLEQVTSPVAVQEKIDDTDYAAALERPATAVTTADAELADVLREDFERWKMFLHPTQRKLVERTYRGPVRISGGPGTGKTIVALHRVKHLVAGLPPGGGKVLLTTFNKNLAADLRNRLRALAGNDALARVDIVNVDKLAADVVAEGDTGRARRLIDDNTAVREWERLLAEENGAQGFDAAFLFEEWSQVILGQGLHTQAEYWRARRAGRGRAISRRDRTQIWKLTERFVMRLENRNLSTFRQVVERAAQIETERAARLREYEARQESSPKLQDESGMRLAPRYRHVVVDEAQDLSPAHWRMLRAMVAPGTDDMFIVGDTHQRIYTNQVSLGSLGISIRGRSSKLTLSYRTTHEILGAAVRLLGGETFDDLDDGHDDLTAYRSVLRGPSPVLQAYPTWNAELDGIAEQVRAWGGGSIAVCVPERRMVKEVMARLATDMVDACPITADGPQRMESPVHVGTMHRFKGLEYQKMIIAGIAEGLVPATRILSMEQEDDLGFRRELRRARSLLFVAVTRARDEVMITWHGSKSRFLP